MTKIGFTDDEIRKLTIQGVVNQLIADVCKERMPEFEAKARQLIKGLSPDGLRMLMSLKVGLELEGKSTNLITLIGEEVSRDPRN